MNFEIELRPHVGTRMEGNMEIEVEQDQYMIFVTGPDLMSLRGRPSEHIGYVGKKPGMPINYLKVAAAFGESTVKIFSQMIRTALVEKARERIEQAKLAAIDAQKLRSEADSLLLDESQANAVDLEEITQLSEAAIEAANQELQDAGDLTEAESQTDRRVNEPTEFYGVIDDQPKTNVAVASDDDQSSESQADSQNL